MLLALLPICFSILVLGWILLLVQGGKLFSIRLAGLGLSITFVTKGNNNDPSAVTGVQ